MARINRESIDRLFDYDLHMETRTIYLGDSDEDGVSPLMAERLIKALHLFTAADPEKEIKIIMNSTGGYWTHGMAIYDAIKACPAHITIEVFGNCMSMATVILQAADERVLHPGTTFMIHDGSDGYIGNTRDFEAWGRFAKVIRLKMYEIYAEKSGRPASHWEKVCGVDVIMTAKDAIKSGLADKIAGEEEEEK